MTTEITTNQNQELLDAIRNNTPQENNFQRLSLPRLGMYSQDKTEGKGKSMTVVAEAGMFYIEHQSEELDENGKRIWVKDEIGTQLEGVIVYFRKQLSMYDNATQKYTNSPIFDDENDVLPLFYDKKEVAKGTAKELKAKYKFVDPNDGKTKSKLQDIKILYVLYQGQLYQMSIKGTSMYAFAAYQRNVMPSIVTTVFGSEAKSQGVTNWNAMTFKQSGKLNDDQLMEVLSYQNQIKASVQAEKEFFADRQENLEAGQAAVADEDWSKDIETELTKALG